jgi:uncharacterized membrane-anchored protein
MQLSTYGVIMIASAPNKVSKVPEIVLTFWVIKIAATTLGETGGDTLSMSFHLGYAVSSLIFFGLFLATVVAQLRAKAFHPWLYWPVIVATTLVGTTVADFADRSMGIGYVGGSSLLFAAVLAVLAAWQLASGSISASGITSVKDESFYWATILASNTLGTALGDLVSDGLGFGFAGGAVFFAALIAVTALIYQFTSASRAALFWAAFILTRPLGATLGDLLTKPVTHGGFDLSRPDSSGLIALFMAACILALPQRAGNH